MEEIKEYLNEHINVCVNETQPEGENVIVVHENSNVKAIEGKLFNMTEAVFCINGEHIFLHERIYGNSIDSSLVQYEKVNNAIKVIYTKLVSLVKYCQESNLKYNKSIVAFLDKPKKSENQQLLKICLNAKLFFSGWARTEYVYTRTCEYLDNEAKINNYCNFVDNTCEMQRGVTKYNNNSCCPKNCKFLGPKGCTTQNLACKLFNCKLLKNQGFVYKAKYILPLQLFFTDPQRKILSVEIFIHRDEILKKLKLARYLGYLII